MNERKRLELKIEGLKYSIKRYRDEIEELEDSDHDYYEDIIDLEVKIEEFQELMDELKKQFRLYSIKDEMNWLFGRIYVSINEGGKYKLTDLDIAKEMKRILG